MTEQRTCRTCGIPLYRKRYPGGRIEGMTAFRSRHFCSVDCANARSEASQARRRELAEKRHHAASTDESPKLTAYQLLEQIVNDRTADPMTRLQAAKALIPYQTRRASGSSSAGKKDERQEAAERVSKGKFQPGAPPQKIIQIKDFDR